jgi:hypothetical protein
MRTFQDNLTGLKGQATKAARDVRAGIIAIGIINCMP